MNYSDARRVATELEKLGYRATPQMKEADVVVLQTCTVRQQSEDKAYNKLHNLKKLKTDDPEKTIAVMGCVVGVRGNETLEETFPFDEVTLVFKVMGKMFALTGLQKETFEVNLKCDPERAMELREEYAQIRAGFI